MCSNGTESRHVTRNKYQAGLGETTGITSQCPSRTLYKAEGVPGRSWGVRFLLLMALTLVTGCTGQLQTKISGNLNQLSRQQVVAILPPEQTGDGQKEASSMFRQSLHANLQHARFQVMERHVVDSLLKQNQLVRPAELKSISPLKLGEVLGADAVVITRINRVRRNYLILHSSIEVDISVQMVDTRTGEILWRAEQTESDFQGLGKIPTGMSSAILAPIQFVTNKLNLHRITHAMVTKLTNLVKRPERAQKEEQFEETVIARAATRDLDHRERHPARRVKRVVKAEVAENQTHHNKKALPVQQSTAPAKPRTPLWETMDIPKPPVRKIQPVGAAPGQEVASIAPATVKVTRVSTEKPPEPAQEKPVHKLQNVRIVNTSQPSTGVLYTLQVGAYKTKAFAERALKSLLSRGHDAFVSWFTKDDQKIYRVHADKFKDRQAALKASQELKSRERINAIITTVNTK